MKSGACCSQFILSPNYQIALRFGPTDGHIYGFVLNNEVQQKDGIFYYMNARI